MNLEQAKRDLSPEEYVSIFLNGNSDMYANGLLKDIDIKELQRFLSSPETYKGKLEKYAMYQYISNGDIFQLFDLVRVLPNLNYKIKTLKTNKKTKDNILNIRRVLKDINHKELTRDILSQVVTTGTVVGVWVGKDDIKSKDNPYLMIFDNLEYFFPARRVKGKWSVWCDLSYFDSVNITSDRKYEVISNLDPFITVEDYERYKTEGEKYRYIEFPVERSIVIRTHTIKRNQRFGIPWNTQAIYDIKHKEKLRNLEKVASNKVMNAVAVLTLGLDNVDESKDKRTWKTLGQPLTSSVFNNVKKGLMENEEGEASVVGLPEWAELSYPDQKTDVLNPDKIETINNDIGNAIGISRTVTNGTSGNYASGKLNLEIIYNRIGELLENIEQEVYNKMIGLILPKTSSMDYYLEYEKAYPLSNKEKSDILFKLHGLGYSLEPLVQMIGIDFNEYVDNSIHEIEDLKLREKIYPPMSTYTISDKSSNTKETDTSNENDNTVQSKQQGGNDTPKANV